MASSIVEIVVTKSIPFPTASRFLSTSASCMLRTINFALVFDCPTLARDCCRSFMDLNDHDGRSNNPLIKALPPATDYLTYLTILEYNLTRDHLPLLHSLLQDTKLTSNIGWDLVHILVPLLPESEQCLLDVACLGNPRETVLKVAELLEEIGHGANAEQSESGQSDGENDAAFQSPESATQNELLIAKFQSLLNMLCVLHPRIKTTHPSRFLVTSMEAILRGYRVLAPCSSATRAVLMFLKSTSGSTRPHLPPRGRRKQFLPYRRPAWPQIQRHRSRLQYRWQKGKIV